MGRKVNSAMRQPVTTFPPIGSGCSCPYGKTGLSTSPRPGSGLTESLPMGEGCGVRDVSAVAAYLIDGAQEGFGVAQLQDEHLIAPVSAPCRDADAPAAQNGALLFD